MMSLSAPATCSGTPLDASDGSIITTIGTGDSDVWAQPLFADQYLFVASQDNGLTAYTTP